MSINHVLLIFLSNLQALFNASSMSSGYSFASPIITGVSFSTFVSTTLSLSSFSFFKILSCSLVKVNDVVNGLITKPSISGFSNTIST